MSNITLGTSTQPAIFLYLVTQHLTRKRKDQAHEHVHTQTHKHKRTHRNTHAHDTHLQHVPSQLFTCIISQGCCHTCRLFYILNICCWKEENYQAKRTEVINLKHFMEIYHVIVDVTRRDKRLSNHGLHLMLSFWRKKLIQTARDFSCEPGTVSDSGQLVASSSPGPLWVALSHPLTGEQSEPSVKLLS